MCSMVTIISNTIVYFKLTKKVKLEHSQQNNKDNCVVINVLINLIVVIISQCVCIPNHHIAHFKYIQCYLSIILQ